MKLPLGKSTVCSMPCIFFAKLKKQKSGFESIYKWKTFLTVTWMIYLCVKSTKYRMYFKMSSAKCKLQCNFSKITLFTMCWYLCKPISVTTDLQSKFYGNWSSCITEPFISLRTAWPSRPLFRLSNTIKTEDKSGIWTWSIETSVTRLGDLLHFGQLFKATIILPKSPTFLYNFCKCFKNFHFSGEFIFGHFL